MGAIAKDAHIIAQCVRQRRDGAGIEIAFTPELIPQLREK